MAMYERSIPPHLTNLNEWYEKIGALDCVKTVVNELEPLLDEFKLKESH